MLKLESKHISASEASQAYAELIVKPEDRKANHCIPFPAKHLLGKLDGVEESEST